jgi:hypothetical protein
MNAHDVYHLICRPGGVSIREILDYSIEYDNVAFSIDLLNEISSMLKHLSELDLVKIKYLPTNWSRVLTKSEVEQLEKFTGE